jgi:cytoskeletal protein CcmA (bactofilin family)
MDTNSQPAAAPAQASVIGEGIAIHGNIEATVDLQIEGKVTGDVRCGTLLLGERAEISGNVFAERVRVSGTVEGSVHTGDLAVEATARLLGDVSYSRIRIANGAIVQGKLSHVPAEAAGEGSGLRLVESPPQSAQGQRGQKSIHIE